MSDATINNILLGSTTILGAVFTAFSVAFVIWTYNDMKARSRDPLAQIAAAVMVALLNVFGLIIYVMLRPRETLADAYERSLEEEALLQEIEEKPACPGCGRDTQVHWQLCPHCHTVLKRPCFNCGELLELSWQICPVCATAQTTNGQEAPEVMIPIGNTAQRSQRVKSPYDVSDTPSLKSQGIEWVE